MHVQSLEDFINIVCMQSFDYRPFRIRLVRGYRGCVAKSANSILHLKYV